MKAEGGKRKAETAAFTLMEIVLAIALTSVVMYLLMTAIELYMVRVDSSRSRVESAQLARTLLDRIADDLTATRLYAPPSSTMGSGEEGQSRPPEGSGDETNASAFGDEDSEDSGSGSDGEGGGEGAATLPSTDVQGVYGTVEQIRIDRAAYPNWRRAAREVTPEEPATVADMPVSVRYYLVDGTRLTSQELALRGVSEEQTSESASGLYREVYATAALAGEADPLATPTRRDGAKLELLAPEVVKMELQYFDGTQLVDEWDSLEESALPAGVEIRLTIYEPSFARSLEDDDEMRETGQPRYRENELVEYRRFVRMPSIAPAQPAEALLPVGGEQRGEQSGSGQGSNGQGQGDENGPQNGENGEQGGDDDN